MNRLKKLLEHDTSLKVFSLIVAGLLWFYIQIAQNPEVSYDILEVPITITGEANINSEGFVVGELPKNLKTKVTVSTKRSLIHNLDTSDLSAVVDVSQCGSAGDFLLPVKVRSTNGEVTVINKSPSDVSIYIDRIVTVEKPVNVSLDGKIGVEYFIDKNSVYVSPEKISVRAPELEANKIAMINVSVDMTNAKSTVSGVYQGVAVDTDGEDVSSENISFITEDVNVKVPVYKRKTLPVEIKNIPSEFEYNLSVEQIEVAGKESIVDGLASIEGFVDDFDIEDIQSSYSVSLKLNNVMLTEKKNVALYPVLQEENGKTDKDGEKNN